MVEPLIAPFPAFFSASHFLIFSSCSLIFASLAAISSGVGPSSGRSARYAFFHVLRCFGGFPGFSGASH